MLRAIRLKNFQSHKDSFLEFADGVNVIVGDSDVGKSAIIRAILWLLTNKTKKNYQSYWSNNIEVELAADDWAIKRMKGKNINEYCLIKNDKERVIKAVGQSVPEEILKVINMNPAINIQMQLEPVFFLSLTSGQATDFLNKTIGLDLASLLERELNSVLRNEKEELKKIKEEKEEIRVKLERTSWITEVERELKEVKKLHFEYQKKKKLISEIEKINEVKKQLISLERITSLESEVEHLFFLYEAYTQIRERIKELSSLVLQVERIKSEIEKEREIFSLSNKVSAIEELIFLIENKKKKKDELKKISLQVRETGELIERVVRQISNLSKRFESLMPEVCPLCGQEVRKNEKETSV